MTTNSAAFNQHHQQQTPSLVLPVAQFQKQWSSLLGAALEAWTHQILYSRRVYSRDSFAPTLFFGIKCYASRHPGVLSYIADALRVAVPALVSGVANEWTLTILDEEVEPENHDDDNDATVTKKTTRELESYVLRFSNKGVPTTTPTTIHAGTKATTAAASSSVPLEYMHRRERDMRDLVLSTLSLDRDSGLMKRSPSMTFKLVLHIPSKNESCSALNEAFAKGSWFVSGTSDTTVADPASHGPKTQQRGSVLRPLHSVPDVGDLGGIQFVALKPTRPRERGTPAISEHKLSVRDDMSKGV